MFDSYDVRPNQSIKINAVTGAILKNHHKSWFERFHLNSQRADRLLREGGDKATKREYDNDAWNSNGRTVRDPENDIIVLQMVICGDMEVMAELIYRKDYEGERDGEK